MAGGLRKLRLVHLGFRGQAERLSLLGLAQPRELRDPFISVSTALERANDREDWGLLAADLCELARLEPRCEAARAALAAQADWTLIHGDLHPRNIVEDGCGDFAIIDWGCAGLQVPAWDLATYPLALALDYLEAMEAGSVSPEAQLRAVVAVRMQWVLRWLVERRPGTARTRGAAAAVALRQLLRTMDGAALS